jgi:hypothetical protein
MSGSVSNFNKYMNSLNNRVMEFPASFSSATFAGVHFDPLDDDFKLIVGDSRFPCSHIAACFLSPTIAQQLLIDRTMTSYCIRTADPDGHFESLPAVCAGSDLVVNSSNKSFFASVSLELGNFELYWLIETDSGRSTLTTRNAVSRYLLKHRCRAFVHCFSSFESFESEQIG